MAEIIVFHHALGRTAGVEAFANALAVAGHDVHTPDLYNGMVFDDLSDGVTHAESIGFDTIAETGARFADSCGDRIVVLGLSLGVLPAQQVAQRRDGVRGAILCHGAVPLGTFTETWPTDVGLQMHAGRLDPFVEEDIDAFEQLAAIAGSELHWYDTAAHLVTDVTSPDYDPAIAARIVNRSLEWIADLD